VPTSSDNTAWEPSGGLTLSPTSASSEPVTPVAPSVRTVEPTKIEAGQHEAAPPDIVRDGVVSQPLPDEASSRVAGIFLGVSGALILVIILVLVFVKHRRQRRRDQDFLLTDSVFRYDGYAQLDEDF